MTVYVSTDLTEAEANTQRALCLNTPGATAQINVQPNGKYTVICDIPDGDGAPPAGNDAGADI